MQFRHENTIDKTDYRIAKTELLIPTLANRGYGIAKTAPSIQPPVVCIASLGIETTRIFQVWLKSMTWLLRSLLLHFTHTLHIMLSIPLVTCHVDMNMDYIDQHGTIILH